MEPWKLKSDVAKRTHGHESFVECLSKTRTVQMIVAEPERVLSDDIAGEGGASLVDWEGCLGLRMIFESSAQLIDFLLDERL